MNAMPDSFVVNSCQYTPIYVLQDPGASQGQSYIITQSNVEDQSPATDNLKAFYESSGNIEGFVNVNSSPKPRILKKQDSGAVGNNLKLASFLQPKNESLKQQYLLNGMVVKPNGSNGITNNTSYSAANNTIFNIDSKIVKLKNVSLKTRCNRIERVPKTRKPKDIVTAVLPAVAVPVTALHVPLNVPATAPAPATTLPDKYGSVQLLKLGDTYHSLNELSDEQMNMVTQALKVFNNTDKTTPEPTYDPVTNTQFIYKVVAPKDLTVVGKDKVPPHKIIEVTKIENIITKELRKEILRETAKKEYVQEAYKKEYSKENVEKEYHAKYKAKQEADIAEARAKKLRMDSVLQAEAKKQSMLKARAEARKDHLFKAEATKKERMLKTEAKKQSMLKARAEAKKEERRREALEQELNMKAEESFKKIQQEILDEQEKATECETKVTRSGRKVKNPKPISPVDTPHKPKKKTTVISCFQCSAEFNSLYRLQKHYESHPTHIPSKIHSNLFHCLLAIVFSGAEGDRTNIFLQQLQQLVVKLRSLLPCFLSTDDDAKACTVSEDVGSLLGLYPGKYTFDIAALDCVKNTEGFCRHKPPPPPSKVEPDTTANQAWATANEDPPTSEKEIEDCARINSVEKWPTVNKRIWKQKQQKSAQENAKRLRLTSENNDQLIELGIDDFVGFSGVSCSEERSAIITPQGAEHKAEVRIVNNECNGFKEISIKLVEEPESLNLPPEPEPNDYLNPTQPIPPTIANLEKIATTIANLEEQNKHNNHLQFHSAHFDIRSSPIKPTSTIFRKFQINPELLAKYENQTIRSIETVDKDHETSLDKSEEDNMTESFEETPQSEDSNLDKEHTNEDTTDHLVGDDTLGEIFRDEDLSAVKESFILDRELKDWILNRSNDDKSEDGFGKPNTVIQPSLIHVKDHEIKTLSDQIEHKVDLQPSDTHVMSESSVLNFLDSFGNDSLSYPGTEIRTNGDFQLDLFSFNST